VTDTGETGPRAGTRSSPFERYDAADVAALIREYPLAWVCASHGGAASLLPLVGVFDAGGELIELIGHFGRSNPLHAAFAADPRAAILFSGPQSYISPRQAGRRNWGPTWNYAQVRIEAEIELEPERTEAALQVLVDMVEANEAEPWCIDELGERYPGMLAQIIGFRARVTDISGRFKLGQDEDIDTLRSILANLPDEALARWMRRMNRARL